MRDDRAVTGREGEQGFTLIEAMVAMIILMFGIVAVSNLMVVAGSSNTVANHGTAAAAVAAEQMELLKSVPFPALVVGGGPTPNGPVDNFNLPAVGPVSTCGSAAPAVPITGTYQCDAQVTGVGQIHVRWLISTLPTPPFGVNTLFIRVAAESRSPVIGRRTRADFTTIRTQQ